MNESRHAQQLVQHFKSLLSDQALEHIDDTCLSQLELMVEAAINASIIETVNQAKAIATKAADHIGQLAEK